MGVVSDGSILTWPPFWHLYCPGNNSALSVLPNLSHEVVLPGTFGPPSLRLCISLRTRVGQLCEAPLPAQSSPVSLGHRSDPCTWRGPYKKWGIKLAGYRRIGLGKIGELCSSVGGGVRSGRPPGQGGPGLHLGPRPCPVSWPGLLAGFS